MSIVRPVVASSAVFFLSITLIGDVSALESPRPGASQAGTVPRVGVPMPHILTLRDQAAVVAKERAYFLDRRQTSLLLIR